MSCTSATAPVRAHAPVQALGSFRIATAQAAPVRAHAPVQAQAAPVRAHAPVQAPGSFRIATTQADHLRRRREERLVRETQERTALTPSGGEATLVVAAPRTTPGIVPASKRQRLDQRQKDVCAPLPGRWVSIPSARRAVSAQIKAELEVGRCVSSKEWARPAAHVQCTDAALSIAVAAELFLPASAMAELFQPRGTPIIRSSAPIVSRLLAGHLEQHASLQETDDADGRGDGGKERPEAQDWCVGSRLEALDKVNVWCPASVVAIRGEGPSRELKVHYVGWTKRMDEWLAVADGRLRAEKRA